MEADSMNAKEAVARRIIELCNGRNMAVNALGNLAGVSPSTIYSILNGKSLNPGVVSIKKLCDGLEISLRQFFDSPLFENLEEET
jgi:transcriptional regulator with XRE-family HTH domain